jgi:hypothetical protein
VKNRLRRAAATLRASDADGEPQTEIRNTYWGTPRVVGATIPREVGIDDVPKSRPPTKGRVHRRISSHDRK